MKNWREDAQRVWPEAASATKEIPAGGRGRDRGDTQVLPEGAVPADGDAAGAAKRLASAAETRLLPGIPRQSEGEAATEVLSSVSGAAPAATGSPDTEVLGGGTRPLPAAGRPAVRDVRDPWQQDAGTAGHTHDPHEVTVQLDAVQLGDGFVRRAGGAPGAGPASSSDGPVFVDASGRRSRRFRRIGMAVALACAGYAVVIVATMLSGNSDAPWLPVPGQQDDRPAGQVDTPPRPARSGPPAGTGTTAPGGTPPTGTATTPPPGAAATVPGVTANPAGPGTDPDPAPAPVRPATPKPSGGGVTDPAPTKPTEPADPSATPDPEPTPTAEPTTGPTGTPDGGGSDGTGTVAGGQATPPPAAESPAGQPAPPAAPAPSPEHVL
ncbi:hypothetical protein [Streptomyces sp. NPDC052701]|uniref:hypothetical protein n=1 Tax=Streptomyces sp. NPDC052701 TaxID=3155533 RepID=UPI003426EEEE